MPNRHRTHRLDTRALVLCSSLLTLIAACSDGGRPLATQSLPTSPSAVSASLPTGDTRNVDAALRNFPSRVGAFQFRTQELEQKYRNMPRPRFPTLVNPEGAVIWVGEYLRYRLAECSHDEALSRVRIQIATEVPQPVCGQNERAFPGRPEALTFRRQLEGIYQARGAGFADTSVDDEGDVIWTMEYYRYVLSGCTHADTVQKIMDQIDGRGVPADCAAVAPRPPPVVVTPPIAALTGSFAVQNTPCVAPASGSVSCRFVASASGAQAPYTFSWRFTTPVSAATPTGQQVSPDLGCNFSTGVATFNVTIALTITPASGSSLTVTGSQQIARAAGACGT